MTASTAADISSTQLQAYDAIGDDCRERLGALYSDTASQFTLSKQKEIAYKINNQAFKLSSSVYKKKMTADNEPTIWYCECVIPGNIRQVYDARSDPLQRDTWDASLAKTVQLPFRMNDKNNSSNNNNNNNNNPDSAVVADFAGATVAPELYILNTRTKPAGGGLISPRDIIALVKTFYFYDESKKCNVIEIASKSVDDYEPLAAVPKGHIRASLVLSGVLFEEIGSASELMATLPVLSPAKTNDNSAEAEQKEYAAEVDNAATKQTIEWTLQKYIVQSDIKGSIPKSVTDVAMTTTINAQIKGLREYMFQTVLGFELQ